MRVDDVLAAEVGAGGREREVVRLDDGRDQIGLPRVLDAGAPRALGERSAAHADVAAGVDRVVPQAVPVEQLAAAVDRPALDETGRVDARQRLEARVEVTAGLLAQLVATGEDGPHVAMALGDRELAAVQAADLAARLVRREALVDLAEPGEQPLERPGVGVVAHVDDDRHAHDLLDAPGAGEPARWRAAHRRVC